MLRFVNENVFYGMLKNADIHNQLVLWARLDSTLVTCGDVVTFMPSGNAAFVKVTFVNENLFYGALKNADIHTSWSFGPDQMMWLMFKALREA